MSKMSEKTSLNDFYSRKTLLLTGSTGFLGKCLLQRILYSFPLLDKVFVLLRPKSGQTAAKRLRDLLSDPIFASLAEEQLAKVHVVSGDVTLEDLALNPNERQLIVDSCHVVLHCAATIRFDEPIRRALQLNVASVQRVLRLAQSCVHLEAMVHVSTAYCTRDRKLVLEEIESDVISGEKFLKSSEWLSDPVLDSISGHFLSSSQFLSTYHFSKSLAENLLLTERGHAPIAIVRPSIVVGAHAHPYPGWTDSNFHGISGFLVAVGKGVLRTLHCDPRLLCDVIPVDIVANTCLAAARHVALSHSLSPLVLNCVSGPLNPITWGQLKTTCLPLLRRFPSSQIMRAPSVSLHASSLVHTCHLVVAHSIPQFVVDLLFRACSLQPILGHVYLKVNRSLKALKPFTTNEWNFRAKNQKDLNSELKGEKDFPIDVGEVNWEEFLMNYVKNIRKLVLKESEESLPKARKQLKRLELVESMANLFFAFFVFAFVRKTLRIRK